MAENEGGDSRFLSGFLLGFLAGVLICLGIGGSFIVIRAQRSAAATREALMEADMARAEAEEAHRRAEMVRARAEKALLEQPKDAGKIAAREQPEALPNPLIEKDPQEK